MTKRSKLYPARIPPVPLRPSRAGMSKRARVRLAYGLGGSIAAVVLVALLLAAFPPNKESLLEVGAVAPAFRLHTFAGREVSLHGPVLLEFCATWPPECATEVPALNRLAASGAAVVSIDGDSENAASVRAFVRFNHVRVPMLLDPGSKTVNFPTRGPRGPLTARYHVKRFPTFYALDARGRVIWRFAGTAGEKRLAAELARAARPVP